MKIVFAGTPEFAASALDALLREGHDIRLVLTQPDRPAGRGLRPRESAVKRMADDRNLSLFQPANLKDPAIGGAIARLEPDVLVVAAFGLILPQSLLDVARLGAINIHASLLPRWRGAAPIQRAILAGDSQTGVTIMQMDPGLDTGAILMQETLAIAQDDTAQSLHDKLAVLGARLIVDALREPCAPRAQDPALATYAAKIDKREALIDWEQSAATIDRQVRAFNPVPGAATTINGTIVKVWRARPEPGTAARPGTVCAADGNGIVVACGNGGLRVLELQRAGGRRQPSPSFISGFGVARGAKFGG